MTGSSREGKPKPSIRVALWLVCLALLARPLTAIASGESDAPPGTPNNQGSSPLSPIPDSLYALAPQGGLANNFTWMLPDLQTLPPSDLRLLVDQGGQKKQLRFSNTVWNAGPGDLEMNGLHDDERDVILITQLIHRLNGNTAGRRIGESVYHPNHEHWHFTGFAIYEIWTSTPDGKLLDIVQSSGKVGYCARDDRRVEAGEAGFSAEPAPDPGSEPEPGPYPGRERALYTGCNWDHQGISPGWKDIYRHHLPGQELDVSHLPDGLYALKSTVNPGGQIIESDLNNNAKATYFLLVDNRLVLVEKFPVDLS